MHVNTIIARLDAMAHDAMRPDDRKVVEAAAEALYQAHNSTLPQIALSATRKKLAEVLDFLEDFAAAKFPAEPAAPISHPADELDPVTDALTVWAWQQDASALLGKITA